MTETNFCQCCGMPLSDEILGTNADKSKNEEYCTYCYQDGKVTFTGTMDEMIEFSVAPMVENIPGMTEETARAQMRAFLPTLKYWAAKQS